MTTPTEFPLHWPHGVPRVTSTTSSQFRTQLPGAIKNVRDSLRKFATESGKPATDVIISSNCSLANNRPDDTGVAIYFKWDGDQVVIPIDRYKKVEDNLQAIHHIIEADRTKLRHGGLHIVKASFAGRKALPAPRGHRDWWLVLGVPRRPIQRDRIDAAFKTLSAVHHPDRGGDAAIMAEINNARDEALAELAQ